MSALPMASLELSSELVHEAAGFRYLVAGEEWSGRLTRLLSECFAREPMSVALGVSARQLAPLVEAFLPECTGNGLSIVAVPEEQPDQLAGAFLSRDYRSPLPSGVPEAYPWFFPVGQALSEVSEAYEVARPGLAPGDAADLWMVGTQQRFAGRGIAGTLFHVAADVAGQSGFRRCVTECTGHFSQRAARRAGFREISRLAYRDFRFQGASVFAGIPAPHAHLVLLEKTF